MGAIVDNDYCSFTKAVEHLGDRWSFLILRELVMFGPQGFNSLATGLPGHVSRSVLVEKLRKLEDLGLVSRTSAGRSRQQPYRLTHVGEGLVPTMQSLQGWAEAWMPEDPAMAERDPDMIWGWLGERINPASLPKQQAVVELAMRNERASRSWIVLQDGIAPFGCLEDPQLDESRYVYIEASVPVLFALARGHRSWASALEDGSVQAFGDPLLVEQLPGWFREAPDARVPGAA